MNDSINPASPTEWARQPVPAQSDCAVRHAKAAQLATHGCARPETMPARPITARGLHKTNAIRSLARSGVTWEYLGRAAMVASGEPCGDVRPWHRLVEQPPRGVRRGRGAVTHACRRSRRSAKGRCPLPRRGRSLVAGHRMHRAGIERRRQRTAHSSSSLKRCGNRPAIVLLKPTAEDQRDPLASSAAMSSSRFSSAANSLSILCCWRNRSMVVRSASMPALSSWCSVRSDTLE